MGAPGQLVARLRQENWAIQRPASHSSECGYSSAGRVWKIKRIFTYRMTEPEIIRSKKVRPLRGQPIVVQNMGIIQLAESEKLRELSH
jgi:hypothetical protein